MFSAAFVNYARQQGFYDVLGEDGEREPRENADPWRRKMAQATTALCSGWVSDRILPLLDIPVMRTHTLFGVN